MDGKIMNGSHFVSFLLGAGVVWGYYRFVKRGG